MYDLADWQLAPAADPAAGSHDHDAWPATPARFEPALLLNASYEPLRVVSWRRAVVLTFIDKVEVIDVYPRLIHSITTSRPLPAVLRLRHRAPLRVREVPFSRTNVYARDALTCQYCGARLAPHLLSYDHVVPRTRGGRTDWGNVVTCCIPCNRRKGDRTPEEVGMRLARRPHRPSQLFLGGLGRVRIPDPWQPYLPARSD
jgi:5-methylcytosine-specific restriction endonuclease McrA